MSPADQDRPDSSKDLERLARAGRDGLRVGVAESLTSGLLCSEIGKGEKASTWFAGGMVSYFTSVKERLLGLPEGVDPCSAECAQQLAVGARTLLKTDVAVSTTGVGGPEPEDGHPPGTVYVGWATRTGIGHHHLQLDGDPSEVLARTVEAALTLLADLADAEMSDTGGAAAG